MHPLCHVFNAGSCRVGAAPVAARHDTRITLWHTPAQAFGTDIRRIGTDGGTDVVENDLTETSGHTPSFTHWRL